MKNTRSWREEGGCEKGKSRRGRGGASAGTEKEEETGYDAEEKYWKAEEKAYEKK